MSARVVHLRPEWTRGRPIGPPAAVVPFPRHRSSRAMARDAWAIVYRIDGATMRNLVNRRLIGLRNAGVPRPAIVADIIEYSAALEAFVLAARGHLQARKRQ